MNRRAHIKKLMALGAASAATRSTLGRNGAVGRSSREE